MSSRCFIALAVLIAGCSGATNNSESSSGYVDGVDAGTSSTGASVTGLPCEVATVLADKCTSCHSSPPAGGAPFPLVSYEDLTKESPSYPGQTIAQRSVARMQDTASPMPPGGGASAEAAACKRGSTGA